MNIVISIKINNKDNSSYIRNYTIYKEDLQQLACNKAREDHPEADSIYTADPLIKITAV